MGCYLAINFLLCGDAVIARSEAMKQSSNGGICSECLATATHGEKRFMKHRILLASIASGLLLSGCAASDVQSAIDQINTSMSDLGKTLTGNSSSNSGSAQPPVQAQAPAQPTAAPPAAKPATSSAGSAPSSAMSAKTKKQLEQVLECKPFTAKLDKDGQALFDKIWAANKAVQLPEPISVFGLSTSKVEFSQEGDVSMSRSYLPGISLQQAIKAAGLKADKNGNYNRSTKVGDLTAHVENGETTLDCFVSDYSE